MLQMTAPIIQFFVAAGKDSARVDLHDEAIAGAGFSRQRFRLGGKMTEFGFCAPVSTGSAQGTSRPPLAASKFHRGRVGAH
jgi:hypothetical protein